MSEQDINKLNICKKIFKQNKKYDVDEKDIDYIFDCIKDIYLYFKDTIQYVKKDDDNYKYYFLSDNNGNYELLDFLINRLFQNVNNINYDYNNMDYSLQKKNINIHKIDFEKKGFNFISDEEKELIHKKRIYHETIHALTFCSSYDNTDLFVKSENQTDNEAKIEYMKTGKDFIEQKLINNFNDISSIVIFNGISGADTTQFNNFSIEAFTESFAVTLSGLRDYFEKNHEEITYNPKRTILYYDDGVIDAPNILSGYRVMSNLAYFLELQSDKKDYFNSMFLNKKDLMESFNKNGEDLFKQVEFATCLLFEYDANNLEDKKRVNDAFLNLTKKYFKVGCSDEVYNYFLTYLPIKSSGEDYEFNNLIEKVIEEEKNEKTI